MVVPDPSSNGSQSSFRSAILLRLADLVEQHADELARLDGEKTGKPRTVMRDGEMPFAIDNLRFFAASARSLHGAAPGEFSTGYTSMLTRRPAGTVAAITPWNFPFIMAVWKVGAALAAGCSVVLKPAPTTPTLVAPARRVGGVGRTPRRRPVGGHRRAVVGGSLTLMAARRHPRRGPRSRRTRPAGAHVPGRRRRMVAGSGTADRRPPSIGETHALTMTLEPGSYQLVYNIAGHYQKGMFTGFTVIG